MVHRRTVNDWYLNAEGQSAEETGYEWENDDRPDRTPDSWLDRHGPADVSLARQNGFTGHQSTSGRGSRSASRPAARCADPSPRDIAKAARALLAAEPGLSYKTVAQRLQQYKGWTKVTRADVSAALASNAPRRASRRRLPSPRPANGGRKQSEREEARFLETLAHTKPAPRAIPCPSCGGAVSISGLCRCSWSTCRSLTSPLGLGQGLTELALRVGTGLLAVMV